MKKLHEILAWAALAAGVSGLVSADELHDSRVSVRGFGTLGAATHDTDGIEYRRNTGQSRGVRAGDVAFDADSLVGAQLDVRLAPAFDVVVQGVSRQRADGGWSPALTQGFVRWSPDESFVLRAGRVGFDIYLLAESRQVGYSYLALRPSPDFYGQVTNDDIDGADVTYTRRVGRGLVRARAFGGASTGELAFANDTHTSTRADVYGFTLDYLWRGWTARIAGVQYNYEPGKDIPLLAGALRMTQFPSALAIADDIDRKIYRSRGMQLGVAYDDGPLLAQVLYGAVYSDTIAGPDFETGYALVGYHLGRLTPFASFASARDRDTVRTAGFAGIPPLAPLDAALVAMQLPTRTTSHTGTIGVRYDVNSHVDLKFQVDRARVDGSAIVFDRRAVPGGPADLTVISAAVDFVF